MYQTINNNFTKFIFPFSGWTSGCSLCTFSDPGCRGPEFVADVKKSTSCFIKVNNDTRWTSDARCITLGRQLRTSLRFYIRFSRCLRPDAIHLIWSLRSST